MKDFTLATALLLTLAAPLAAQEPVPPPPPPETPAPESAEAPAQEPVTEEMILQAIDKVRGSYDRADESVRTGVQAEAPDAISRGEAISPAVDAVGTLIADMEALLELLPEPPS